MTQAIAVTKMTVNHTPIAVFLSSLDDGLLEVEPEVSPDSEDIVLVV